MRFSLGFTADAAAAHRHEFSQPETVTSTPTSTLGMLGLPRPRDVSLARHSMPPILTSRPSQSIIEESSSGEDDDDEGEETATVAMGKSRPQQSARPKTVFQFAHPVASRRRLKLRLKLLLQLHEIQRSSRPFPIYDVFPADVPTKLICRISKPYGTTRVFGPKDLVVVTSDMYEQQSLSASDDRSVSSEESCQEQREVVATICQSGPSDAPRKPVFEIAFSSGVCWEGVQLPNGSYELVSNGGTIPSRKVRWVARDRKPVRQGPGMSSGSISGASRFTFSVINPNTRQHPVIASMTRKGLTVFDQFTYPTAFSADDEQSPPGSPSTSSTKSCTDRVLINTDNELRKVIVMTGIWVAFMEGWSSRSLLSGDIPIRTDSALSPRSRSSTFLSADGGDIAEGRSSLSTRPSALNSLKVINRRSTQSDLGRDRSAERGGICGMRRSKSLTAADRRDLQWTSVETAAAESDHTPRPAPDQARLDIVPVEAATKAKSKGWRRFSSMLRRKRP